MVTCIYSFYVSVSDATCSATNGCAGCSAGLPMCTETDCFNCGFPMLLPGYQENPNYLTPPSDPNLLENKGGVRYLGVLDQIWLQKNRAFGAILIISAL